MRLKNGLKELYKTLTNDEVLLRLLYYLPKNALDDPLSTSKPDITSMSSKDKNDIIKNVLLPSDKKYDLDLSPKICRVCFYTGTRQPLPFVATTGRQQDNPYVSEQKYNFDVYVHVDIDIVDFRLNAICDRLNEIMLLQHTSDDVGKFVLDFISPINNTPDGMIALKMVYKTVSLQESTKGKSYK